MWFLSSFHKYLKEFGKFCFKFLRTGRCSESGIWLWWLMFAFKTEQLLGSIHPNYLSSPLPITRNPTVAEIVTPSLIYEFNFYASLTNNDDYSGFWCPSYSHSSGASIKVTNRSNYIRKFLWQDIQLAVDCISIWILSGSLPLSLCET